jgi:Rrf2 family protein
LFSTVIRIGSRSKPNEKKERTVKITRQADYAVRVLVYLSELPLDTRVTTGTISEAESIPLPFLAKVISGLVTAGLVVTSRGMGGGVALARAPEEITLLQVIQAVDGPIWLSQTLLRPESGELGFDFAVRDVWDSLQAGLVQDLDAVTMRELARRQVEKKAKH